MLITSMRYFLSFVFILLSISFTAFTSEEKSVPNDLQIETKEVALQGNIQQLKHFFKALDNSKKQVVRIGHYGDSSLLGDVISENLRYSFQADYGGKGIGFLNACASDVAMRQSVLHSFSDDWEYTSLFLRNPKGLAFGVSGYVAMPAEGSWVKYETTNFIKNLTEFDDAELFYRGGNNSSNIVVEVDGKKQTMKLEAAKRLNTVPILKGGGKSVQLTFNNCTDMEVYGVSFEKGNGVYLDNYPITGNTGVSLLDIDKRTYKEFQKHTDYNLFILHYGMNLPTPKSGILKIYKNKMLKVIQMLKDVFPEAGILMISISDRIIKKGSRIITSRETLPIIKEQIDIAKEADVAFWNLFEAMGGKDSMDKWVSSAPPLALKDYKHFNHEGGEIVAKLFYKAIMGAKERVK